LIPSNYNPNLDNFKNFKQNYHKLNPAQKNQFWSELALQIQSITHKLSELNIAIGHDSLFIIADFENQNFKVIVGDFGTMKIAPNLLAKIWFNLNKQKPRINSDIFGTKVLDKSDILDINTRFVPEIIKMLKSGLDN
jgi:hypothetical protein